MRVSSEGKRRRVRRVLDKGGWIGVAGRVGALLVRERTHVRSRGQDQAQSMGGAEE